MNTDMHLYYLQSLYSLLESREELHLSRAEVDGLVLKDRAWESSEPLPDDIADLWGSVAGEGHHVREASHFAQPWKSSLSHVNGV